jgi:hypothetical protein
MLYKFKSRATADLILLEPHARRLLELAGKDAVAQGIITAAQIPPAIAALEAAVLDEERRLAEAGKTADAEDEPQQEPDGRERDTVTLRQRAVPFIDMLRRSAAEGKDVVWGA